MQPRPPRTRFTHYADLRFRVLCILSLCLGLAFSWPSTAAAQTASPQSAGQSYRPGHLLVGFDPDVSPDTVIDAITAQGMTVQRVYPRFHLIEAALPQTEVGAAADQAVTATLAAQAALEQRPGVRYAELDYQVQIAQETPGDSPAPAATTVNDPYIGQQWALTKLSAFDGWNIAHGDPDFVVAIIDSGYDSNHPDIPTNRVWVNPVEQTGLAGVDDDANGYVDDIHGWDWVGLANRPGDEDNDPNDLHGHGTHVFGVVAAAVDNGIGIAGLGPRLRAAPLRVLAANGSGWVVDVIAALDYALTMDFRIANLSLTIDSASAALEDAVIAATENGMIVVAAAGNNGDGPNPWVRWPAAFPQTLAVAATTETDTRAYFSNYGNEIDLAAPGSDIFSTFLGGVYRSLSGTSMASPHVAAAAALVWSLRPDLTAAQVTALLTMTAADVNVDTLPGQDQELGAGRIDLRAALLNASAGLTLANIGLNSPVVLPTALLTFPIAVTAPGGLPVEGAVIRYWLVDGVTNGVVSGEQQQVSGADGIGSLTMAAPAQGGAYYVQAVVGSASLKVPLIVHATPISITVALSQTETHVDGAPLDMRIELRDLSGNLVPDTLPVHLQTTLGSLNAGSLVQSQDLIVYGGLYTNRFYPLTTSGIAQITADLGPWIGQTTLTILPDPPAQVIGPADGIPPVTIAANQLELVFLVRDRFGNPVADGIQVEFETGDGFLTPASTTTVNGQATSRLTLAPNLIQTATVRVLIASAGIDLTLNIPLDLHYFLPFLRRD